MSWSGIFKPSEKTALSLRSNFAWMLGGNVYYAACQWSMLVIIAKFGNPEMVGRFVLGLAISAPVIMFSNLNLRLVLATDSREVYPFGSYLALRLTTAPLAVAVVAGIMLFLGYPAETAWVVIIVGVAKAFEAISEIYYGLMQFHERLDRVARSMMLKGSLALLLLGVGVRWGKSLLWGALGLAGAMALTLFIRDIGSARRLARAGKRGDDPDAEPVLTARWEARLLRNLAIFTLPLGVMVLFQSLNMNIPRFLIERHLGEHALGIFAALAYVMVAGTIFIRALGHAASPTLARYYNGGERKRFYRLSALLVAAGAGIGLAGIGIAVVAGPWILRVMYTPEYSRHAPLFVSLMLAALFLYAAQLLDFSVAVVRWFPAQMVLAAFVSVLTLVLGIWLIPRAGLLGASQALLWGGVTKVIGNLAIMGFAARAAARGDAPEPLALEMDPS